MTKLEESAILTARIRALQAIYKPEHDALCNWAKWSRDERGIRPVEARTSIYDQMNEDDRAGWGEETDQPPIYRLTVRVKSERPEEENYDLKSAEILDERIHGNGGLASEIQHLLRIAYVTRDVPEYQFPNRCSCSWDGFCERLEEALRFVSRFV